MTSSAPPIPKQRTKFNIPLEDDTNIEGSRNDVHLKDMETKTRIVPPPRPPPPKLKPTLVVHEEEVDFVENPIYLYPQLIFGRPSDSFPPPRPPSIYPNLKVSPIPNHPPPIVSVPSPAPAPSLSTSSPSTSLDNNSLDSNSDVVVLADDLDDTVLAEGSRVSYSSYVTLLLDKKKKRSYARLVEHSLTFYSNIDTTDEEKPLMDTIDLQQLVLITAIGQNISMYITNANECTVVRFTPEDQFDVWIMMIAESYLSEADLLRSSLRVWTSMGRAWTRQGATGEWKKSIVVIDDNLLYSLDSIDSLFITDIRKVHTVRGKLDKSEWCPQLKKKGQEGPILLTLDASSLALEAEAAICTKEWKETIDCVTRRKQESLQNCRLASNGVPIAVEKCIAFINAHGMDVEGLYRKNGNRSKERNLLKQLIEDPHSAILSMESDESVFVVADVLRQFLRHMTLPLLPPDIHSKLFQFLEHNPTEKIMQVTVMLESLPEVHYCTLRRIIGHLVDVTSNSSKSLASMENVAKVFAPTIFTVNSSDISESHSQMGLQMSAIIIFIQHFSLIFRETPREAASRAVLMDAKRKPTVKNRAEGMLVSISLWPSLNRAFNVNSHLAAEEALTQAFALRDVHPSPNAKYALFEIVDGHLCRRLFPEEKLSSVVLDRWLRWKVAANSQLKVDVDMHPVNTQLISHSTGKVKVALENARFFHTCQFGLEGGTTITMNSFKSGKLMRKWEIKDIVVYEGSLRKPSHQCALTFIPVSWSGTMDKYTGITVHFKDDVKRRRFLDAILSLHSLIQPPLLVHL